MHDAIKGSRHCGGSAQIVMEKSWECYRPFPKNKQGAESKDSAQNKELSNPVTELHGQDMKKTVDSFHGVTKCMGPKV